MKGGTWDAHVDVIKVVVVRLVPRLKVPLGDKAEAILVCTHTHTRTVIGYTGRALLSGVCVFSQDSPVYLRAMRATSLLHSST